jgi:hypothetical protein
MSLENASRTIAPRPRPLRGLELFTEQESKGLLDNYIGARTPEERMVAAMNLESAAFRRLTENTELMKSLLPRFTITIKVLEPLPKVYSRQRLYG